MCVCVCIYKYIYIYIYQCAIHRPTPPVDVVDVLHCGLWMRPVAMMWAALLCVGSPVSATSALASFYFTLCFAILVCEPLHSYEMLWADSLEQVSFLVVLEYPSSLCILT